MEICPKCGGILKQHCILYRCTTCYTVYRKGEKHEGVNYRAAERERKRM
jgi:uncharacterized protein with PIN domain